MKTVRVVDRIARSYGADHSDLIASVPSNRVTPSILPNCRASSAQSLDSTIQITGIDSDQNLGSKLAGRTLRNRQESGDISVAITLVSLCNIGRNREPSCESTDRESQSPSTPSYTDKGQPTIDEPISKHPNLQTPSSIAPQDKSRLNYSEQPSYRPTAPITQVTTALLDLLPRYSPLSQSLPLILPACHPFHPSRILHVPTNGLSNRLFEHSYRCPAQFLLDLAGVDGVATVVSRSVFDERDQAFAIVLQVRKSFLNRCANRLHNVDVGAFAVAADVIGLSDLATFQDRFQSGTMVFNKQPVANIQSIAVDGQWLPAESH